MATRVLSATVLIVLLATTAVAQNGADARLATDVGRAIGTNTQLSIFDHVGGRVENGVVTITGNVTAEYKKAEIGRLVARLEGVREVRNQIAVLPPSPFDDELRYRAARAIYSNPAFWSYASMPRPPIHIIVEQGRVTLRGVVASDVERALARSLATGLGEVSVTSELQTDRGASRHVSGASYVRRP